MYVWPACFTLLLMVGNETPALFPVGNYLLRVLWIGERSSVRGDVLVSVGASIVSGPEQWVRGREARITARIAPDNKFFCELRDALGVPVGLAVSAWIELAVDRLFCAQLRHQDGYHVWHGYESFSPLGAAL